MDEYDLLERSKDRPPARKSWVATLPLRLPAASPCQVRGVSLLLSFILVLPPQHTHQDPSPESQGVFSAARHPH